MAELIEAALGAIMREGVVRGVLFESLSEDLRAILSGGLVIRAKVVASLGIKKMDIPDGTTRDGLIEDLAGRMT